VHKHKWGIILRVVDAGNPQDDRVHGERDDVSFQTCQMKAVSVRIKISGVESLALNRIFYIAARREKSSSKRPDQATVVFDPRRRGRAFSRFSAEITCA